MLLAISNFQKTCADYHDFFHLQQGYSLMLVTYHLFGQYNGGIVCKYKADEGHFAEFYSMKSESEKFR